VLAKSKASMVEDLNNIVSKMLIVDDLSEMKICEFEVERLEANMRNSDLLYSKSLSRMFNVQWLFGRCVALYSYHGDVRSVSSEHPHPPTEGLHRPSNKETVVIWAYCHSAILASSVVWILGSKVIIIHVQCRRKNWS
jgi:hypothetical protein